MRSIFKGVGGNRMVDRACPSLQRVAESEEAATRGEIRANAPLWECERVDRLGSRRTLLLFVAAASLLGSGCSTVFARGVVRDAAGVPLGNVSVRITSIQTGELIAASITDAGGCFLLFKPAPPGEKRFKLDASVPGFKPATFTASFQRQILLGTLATVSSEQPSSFRLLGNEEAYAEWEMTCWPPSPVGN